MLETILATKRVELARRQRAVPLGDLLARVTPSDRDFLAALADPAPAFILEVKPRSPSAGKLRAPSNLESLLAGYRRWANVVSVLTDETYFGGSGELLARVRQSVPQPVMCKDFILDPYQVVEARSHGADAVLLILAVLDDRAYQACVAQAGHLRMGVLTEVHDAAEMSRAVRLGAAAIGINSRNLADLAVDSSIVTRLAPLAPRHAIVIAESGISGHDDVVRLRRHVDGYLIGTVLMRAYDPDRAARTLIFGPTKVCGLTNSDDAAAAADRGATHGGLVFAADSPRRLSAGSAAVVRGNALLDWVGVFANQPAALIAGLAADLGLASVQLHGDERPDELRDLRAILPEKVEIWKGEQIRDRIPPVEGSGADRIVLDGYRDGVRGGSGARFDWALLVDLPNPDRYLLAGGLEPANVTVAQATGVHFLDVSSGLESTPGRKDPARLTAFFRARRNPRRRLR